ncbi:MAG: HAMP domain-containing histidine kinase [Lachnospiraceae bacterium]|nr:HAMP domain-containing histidine kinase [Lachnospiraceae bacterium]
MKLIRRKRKKGFILSNINIFFTILVLVEFIFTIAFASFVQWILESVLQITIPTTLFLLLVGAFMGSAIAFLVNRIFFEPIQKLKDGMNDVSDGDFTVKIDTNSPINEVRELYDSFDLMVKELSATEILQSDFMSNVSHEIKTPVNAIEGYAMLLESEEITPEEQQEYVEKILFNTKRLSELVGNVLLLSKIDNQAIPKNEKKFRLDEQIRQSIMQLETKWTEKDIELDVELERTEFIGNATLLIHVWDNLINNAIKFNNHGGTVKLRLSSNADRVTFTIEDNGPGVSEDAIKHIFDKFYQADSSHRQEGNGLGLALVKRIVDLYEGDIKAENLPDTGCRFTVVLPAMQE